MGLFGRLFGRDERIGYSDEPKKPEAREFDLKEFERRKIEHMEKRKSLLNRYLDASSGVFEVTEVFEITGIGLVPVGKVKGGNIKPGYIAEIKGNEITVGTIEMFHESLDIAVREDDIGLNLKGKIKKQDIQRGDVITFRKKED
ncbi:MAG: EF-Tu/IF-2/RF-3 family GTPase [Candidatus Altiarchaeota archaeon]